MPKLPWRHGWIFQPSRAHARGCNTLLRRIYDISAPRCDCGEGLQIVALGDQAHALSETFERLHLPTAPPPIACAGSPDF